MIEVTYQAVTGELGESFNAAFEGDFSGLDKSAGKIAVAGASSGVSSILTRQGAALAVKGAQAVGLGAKATKAAEVGGVVATQATLGAATRAGMNVVDEKPILEDVGAAAVISGTIGTIGTYAGEKVSQAGGATIGSKAAAGFTRVLTGGAKKGASEAVQKDPCQQTPESCKN